MGIEVKSKEDLREEAKRVVDDPRYYLGGMRGRYQNGRGVRDRGGSQGFDVFASDATSVQALARVQYLFGLKSLLEEDGLVGEPD